MTPPAWRTPLMMLIAGSLVLCISFGLRHTFGLFLQPMSLDLGWGRGVFALAMAIQNLAWGLSQPFAGRLADRFGAGWLVIAGGILYAAGLYLMSQITHEASETDLIISAGVLIGLGLSGTTYPVVFGVISRALPIEKRSWAMGVSMSVGSFGQFLFLPIGNALIFGAGWSQTLLIMTVLSLLMIPLALALMEPVRAPQPSVLSVGAALAEAGRHKGFWLLSFGFFVCGFQVVFIGIHLPAYLVDQGLSPGVGAVVLGLIGLFNVIGSYLAGVWGGRMPKPKLLSGIYTGRMVVILLFLLVPLSSVSAYVFGMAMGLLWLSTVPLTNGTVATLFGVENLSMLGGIVFLFHQLGAFLGGWLGGYLYDLLGSYDAVWMISIALSLMAALLNLPIREQPVARLTQGL